MKFFVPNSASNTVANLNNVGRNKRSVVTKNACSMQLRLECRQEFYELQTVTWDIYQNNLDRNNSIVVALHELDPGHELSKTR